MKILKRFLKPISILLIFTLLVELTGCQRHSFEAFTSNEITPERYYIVHSGNKANYKTIDLSVKDSVVHGKIYFNKIPRGAELNAHIYLRSDSTLVIVNDKIKFPLSSVKTMKELVYDREKSKKATTLLVLGSVAGGALLVIGVVSMINTAENCGDDIVDIIDGWGSCGDY